MGAIEDLKKDVSDLTDAVTAENTVIDSAITLLNGQTAKYDILNKQLADAIAANDPIAIQNAADALTAQNQIIKDKTSVLATAVAANTPAETPA